jgi:hypothetical protein
MRKTHISLFFLVCLAVFLGPLFPAASSAENKPGFQEFLAPVAAQAGDIKKIPRLIRDSKAAGVSFQRRNLFRAQNRLFRPDHRAIARDEQLAALLNDGVISDIDKPAAAKLLNDDVKFLTLSLPDHKGAIIDVELVKVDIFAPGFSIRTAKRANEVRKDDLGAHYRGIVKGNEQSLVAISVFKNEIVGFVSTEADGNSVLGRLGGDNPDDTHVVYSETDLNVTPEFSCETKDTTAVYPASVLQFPEQLPGACVRIYVEVDFDVFQNKGSNVTNTVNFVTALFNQSATLFANDGISLSLSALLVWDIQSPYAGLNTSSALLNKFNQVRTSFNGDFGHLLALRGNGGVAAGIDTYCASSSARQCFSGIDATFQNVPTYSWSVEVFTHELGHLMGSRHTHACAWNGNGTAIDGCGPAAGFPYEGSCSGAPVPSNGGTIMSYCHLSPPNPGINFTLGFGPQPRNVIVNGINSASCLSSCIPPPPNDNFANAQVLPTISSGSVSGTNAGATKEPGEPNHAFNAGGKSVWYRWQAPSNGTVTITTSGSNFDSLLGVYTGSSVGSLSLVASNDDDPNGGVTSRVSFTATSGTTYRIAVDGFNGAAGNINLNWSLSGPPAAPASQPATNISNSSFTANWTSSSGANGYRLDVSTNSSFSSFVSGYQNLDVGNALSRSVTGLSPATTFHYRVRAYNTAGTSSDSGTIQATTNTGAVNYALALNGSTASASSSYSVAYPAANLINGERAGANSTTGGVFNGWVSSTATMPQWVEVNFGQARSIREIDVFTIQDNYQNPVNPTLQMTFSSFGLVGFDVQYWNGTSWVTISGGSVTANNKVWRQFIFAAINTSQIRVLINASPDGFSRLNEIEAWGTGP